MLSISKKKLVFIFIVAITIGITAIYLLSKRDDNVFVIDNTIKSDNDLLDVGDWYYLTDDDMTLYYDDTASFLMASDLYNTYPDLYTYIACGIKAEHLDNKLYYTSNNSMLITYDGDICVYEISCGKIKKYAYIDTAKRRVCISDMQPVVED